MKAAIKVIPIILIIAAFTAILSVNLYASYDANSINRFRIYNYVLLDDTGLTQTSNLYGTVLNDGSTYDTGYRTTYTAVNNTFWVYYDPVLTYHIKLSFKAYCLSDNEEKFGLSFTQNQDYSLKEGGTFNPYRPISQIRYRINGDAGHNLNLFVPTSTIVSGSSFRENFSSDKYIQMSIVNNELYYTLELNFDTPYNTEYLSFKVPISYISSRLVLDDYSLTINGEEYYLANISSDVESIKDDISDIKEAIVGTETVPIDNSGEDHLLDKLEEETGVINDMIDEFRAFDISRYTGGIYAVMYMSTPWTNQEWFKAVMVVLLTLFALITVVRGLRR